MKILKVIHGYPIRYNAGSEVYTQTLCHELVKRHEVAVFSRFENPFLPDYTVVEEKDAIQPEVSLNLINLPLEKHRYRYRDPKVDRRFNECLNHFKPDVIHIGHLNHLSCSLVKVAKKKRLPIFFTLHDFWLLCPRGQFLQRKLSESELFPLCGGQNDHKCANKCFACYHSGALEDREVNQRQWTEWVAQRMAYIREIVPLVDNFFSPSQTVLEKIQTAFQIPQKKMVFLDYGFDLSRFKKSNLSKHECFTFGYIGTHIPAKGIHHLIEAFSLVKGKAKLMIWGRSRSVYTDFLKELAGKEKNIIWRDEYRNENIAEDVFQHIDALVVPSIWLENSPLVIHEAQAMKVPVITANVGGMAEYVQHGVNGLLFKHRCPNDLSKQMQTLVDDRKVGKKLGAKGYLFSKNGEIPCIEEHARILENYYNRKFYES